MLGDTELISSQSGYGQPPDSLPTNSGDIFLDFTTPNFPLVYIYNHKPDHKRWVVWNEDVVLKNDRTCWLGVCEHPVFPDRYLWCTDKKGFHWSSHGAFKGSPLVSLNDDRPEFAGWWTKYMCVAFEVIAPCLPRELEL